MRRSGHRGDARGPATIIAVSWYTGRGDFKAKMNFQGTLFLVGFVEK